MIFQNYERFLITMRTEPINVVWRRQDIAQVLESRFLHDLIRRASGRPLRFFFWGDDDVPRGDVLVAALGESDNGLTTALRRHGCRRLGVLHMGDEQGKADTAFYAQADYVLRNYYFPGVVRPRPSDGGPPVIWVPNGCRDGLGGRSAADILPASQRRNLGFFSGMISGASAPARRLMIEAVQRDNLPCALFGSHAFGGGFCPAEYSARMESGVFGLTPAGNSVETIRLYDCLELGAIPIMLKADFLEAPDALGGVPFPALDDWGEMAALFACFARRDDPAVAADLDAWQQEVIAWWRAFKECKAAEIGRAIMGRR